MSSPLPPPYHNAPQGKKPSSRHRNRPETWKIVVGCLLIAVAVGAVWAYRTEHRPSSKEASAETSTSPVRPRHFDNLEIARYTGKKSEASAVRKDYMGFSVSFNTSNHTPDWVGWELLGTETDGGSARSNRFWGDPDLEGSAWPEDYRNSGYDKGHLCPSADQKWSEEAMRDCFVMANMAPQAHALNGGAWKTLETKERLWAQRDSALIIVAGPIYSPTDRKTIGENKVRVPSAFFKVLLAPYVESPRAIGFVYPNADAPGNMENYCMSVDEVEALTGLDFFSGLPDDLESEVERATSFTEWNRR